VLFASTHEIGTRAGAIAVSRDIRATGARRLRRVDGVEKPNLTADRAARWIAVEHRLVARYAADYLAIWDAIEQANTPRTKAALPAKLARLIHDPDRLARHAVALERLLQVPDCTGGIRPPGSSPSPHP
jgi:hypothetical protein